MRKAWLIVWFVGTLIIFTACQSKEPIKVGIFTRLEAGSIIGASEIDTVKMYLENAHIDDIKIYPFNDNWDPERIESVYKDARSQGVNIFFTSHTSTCAMELKRLTDMEKEDVLVMITGSTTDLLSNLDDNNIRVIQDVHSEQKSIGIELERYQLENLVIARDTDNYRYTNPALKYFLENYSGQTTLVDFSVNDFDISAMKTQLSTLDFDAVYTLIGGNQTISGSIAQLAYNINPQVTVFFTPWNNATTVIETAGDAIDVCIMANHYPFQGDSEVVKHYMDSFKEKYQYAPTYNSLHLYRAISILATAIKQGHTQPKDIKQYIIETQRFETEFGPMEFSPTGDVDMPLYFITDIKGAF